MKKLLLALSALLVLCSCGKDQTPVEKWVTASKDMRQELNKSKPDMNKLKELDEEMTRVIEENKDYALTDADRDLLASSVKQTYPLVYKYTHKISDSYKWDEMAKAFNHCLDVRWALNDVKTLGEFGDVDLNQIWRDVMYDNNL